MGYYLKLVHYLQMNKVSHRAGYVTSVLAIIYFGMGTIYTQTHEFIPSWFPILMGLIMTLSACSGVVCLVSLFFGFLRNRKRNSN